MVGPNESARERTRRVCGMFTDYWHELDIKDQKILLVGGGLDSLHRELQESGNAVEWWSWLPEPSKESVPFPTTSKFSHAIFRITPEKERVRLCIEVIASRLEPTGQLWLVGSNDEGIKSTSEIGHPFFEKGRGVNSRKHARIMHFYRRETGAPRTRFDDFKESCELPIGDGVAPWTYFPGMFAKGKLDRGTALLLSALPPQTNINRVLDYGCGSGVILGFSSLQKAREMHAVDRDYFAVKATNMNLPSVVTYWANGPHVVDGTFDFIVSNPPIHDGKIEDHSPVVNLIDYASSNLASQGEMWLVVQHRVAMETLLSARFRKFEIAARDSVFKVWRVYQNE